MNPNLFTIFTRQSKNDRRESFNIWGRLGPTRFAWNRKMEKFSESSFPSIKLINILIREHVCLGWLSKMGKITICRCQEKAEGWYQQGILSPQSKNFNSLDNIFREYSKISYLEGLKLNRKTIKSSTFWGFYVHI